MARKSQQWSDVGRKNCVSYGRNGIDIFQEEKESKVAGG